MRRMTRMVPSDMNLSPLAGPHRTLRLVVPEASDPAALIRLPPGRLVPKVSLGISDELRVVWMIDSLHSAAGVHRRGIMVVIV